MATNNSQNSQYANNADGFTLGGGTTSRSLTVTGGNVTVTGSGSNTYTMPAASDTLVGRASTDTLTNKSISGSNNTVSNLPTSALILGGSQADYIATSQTTTSTSYTDLATVGPTVTVTIGASGMALVLWSTRRFNSGVNWTSMSFDVSGANTIAATDSDTLSSSTGIDIVDGTQVLLTGLSPGSTTFKAKYRVTGGTGTWIDRRLSVIPL